MKYKERTHLPFSWRFQDGKVLDAENQAYIDVLGSASVSNLIKLYNSPHFCNFYGCFRTVIDVFKYNLEEDFEDIRFTNWFWNSVESKEFTIHITDKITKRELTLDEIKELFKPDDEYLEDSDSDSGSDSGSDSDSESESDSDSESDDNLSAEEIDVVDFKANITSELKEFKFDDEITNKEPIILRKISV